MISLEDWKILKGGLDHCIKPRNLRWQRTSTRDIIQKVHLKEGRWRLVVDWNEVQTGAGLDFGMCINVQIQLRYFKILYLDPIWRTLHITSKYLTVFPMSINCISEMSRSRLSTCILNPLSFILQRVAERWLRLWLFDGWKFRKFGVAKMPTSKL